MVTIRNQQGTGTEVFQTITTNTFPYEPGTVIRISSADSYDYTCIVINNSITGHTCKILVEDEYVNKSRNPSKKHKGQRYKPTAFDKLNQSKQSKFKK